jgi:hypothetical protein
VALAVKRDESTLNLIANVSEFLQCLSRWCAGRIRERPVQPFHSPGNDRAHFVGTERDDQIHGGGIDTGDSL